MVFASCKSGDLSLLRASLIAPKTQLEKRDATGKTPLLRAVKYGHVDVVAFLLQQGANLHTCCTKQQRNCMHLAASGGHLLVAKLLLQHGAATQLQQPDRKGRLPAQVIGTRNRADLQQLFSVRRQGSTSQCSCSTTNAPQDTVNALSTAQAEQRSDSPPKEQQTGVQGTFNMWNQQALGLDPIREERTSSEASSGRRSLQTVRVFQPSADNDSINAADLFWLASDRRRSTSFEPMYYDPSSADAGAPLHQRRSLDARLAEKPQRRASFDVDRRVSCDLPRPPAEGTQDPVAWATAAVSHAVQARASFESTRASFDMPLAPGRRSGRRDWVV